jgi:hypothetical protein
MPARPAVPSLPIPLDLVPAALARRGVQVSARRLQEAVSAGAVPSRLEGGRRLIEETDLPAVERYFRENPPGAPRAGAAALARAGRR